MDSPEENSCCGFLVALKKPAHPGSFRFEIEIAIGFAHRLIEALIAVPRWRGIVNQRKKNANGIERYFGKNPHQITAKRGQLLKPNWQIEAAPRGKLSND